MDDDPVLIEIAWDEFKKSAAFKALGNLSEDTLRSVQAAFNYGWLARGVLDTVDDAIYLLDAIREKQNERNEDANRNPAPSRSPLN